MRINHRLLGNRALKGDQRKLPAMAKVNDIDRQYEQNLTNGVSDKDVKGANIKPVEGNGETEKQDVQEKDMMATEDTKIGADKAMEEKMEKEKETEAVRNEVSPSPVVKKISSFREEINFLSNFKLNEKKILAKLKTRINEVIHGKVVTQESPKNSAETVEVKVVEKNDEAERRYVSPPPIYPKNSSFREESNCPWDLKEHEKKALTELKAKVEDAISGNNLLGGKKEKSVLKANAKSLEECKEKEKEKEKKAEENGKNGGLVAKEEKDGEGDEKDDAKDGVESKKEDEEKKKPLEEAARENTEEEEKETVHRDITLWGVPLLPSKGDSATDVIFLKFLRAREFNVNSAFEMLRNTLQWRKENNLDSILNESFDADFGPVGNMNGVDREGHPVCYNNFGLLGNSEKVGSEEKREKFLRWRVQLMEKGIQKLDFKPGGVSSLLQISNLEETPCPSKKELRLATKNVIWVLQDNYPELAAKNIFINVPFWYYALSVLLSPFLTQRTKNKFVFARPARVAETLVKYIAAEEIPIHYGGLKRENDCEFSTEDTVMEVAVKAVSTESIEIPVSETGATLIWDLTVLGWEVSYKAEFAPSNEASYSIIIERGRKMSMKDGPVRNSFKNKEPGKVLLTVENVSFKKKCLLYRYKIKNSSLS